MRWQPAGSCGIATCKRNTTREVELKPLLTVETVKGRILSLDALHTQREFCAQVKRLEGDYVLMAKDNQPTLKEDIADLFLRPDS